MAYSYESVFKTHFNEASMSFLMQYTTKMKSRKPIRALPSSSILCATMKKESWALCIIFRLDLCIYGFHIFVRTFPFEISACFCDRTFMEYLIYISKISKNHERVGNGCLVFSIYNMFAPHKETLESVMTFPTTKQLPFENYHF